MNILIIGAGPTGLTAALECALQGITPRIVDAKEAPSILSRAVGILPRSMEILSRSGVGGKIVEEGVKLSKVNIDRGTSDFLDLDFTPFLDEKHMLIGLAQDRTETIMSEKLEEFGVEVEYNTKVVSVENVDEGVDVVFEGGEESKYDYVIGADGVSSTVRKSLNIPFEGYELGEEWSIADVTLEEGYDTSVVRAWFLKSGRDERDIMVMIAIAPNRVRLVSSTPDSLKALPIDLPVKEVRRSGIFKISVRQASRYVDGRVILAGDAAHVHSPVGGRGMNLGIEDASSAVEALLSGSLDNYNKERRAKAGNVIRGTERVRKALVSNNIFTGFILRVIAFCISNIPLFTRRFAQNLMKL